MRRSTASMYVRRPLDPFASAIGHGPNDAGARLDVGRLGIHADEAAHVLQRRGRIGDHVLVAHGQQMVDRRGDGRVCSVSQAAK